MQARLSARCAVTTGLFLSVCATTSRTNGWSVLRADCIYSHPHVDCCLPATTHLLQDFSAVLPLESDFSRDPFHNDVRLL